MDDRRLAGPRHEIDCFSDSFPESLRQVANAPRRLYCIGNPDALRDGLAIVGARNATPYGLSCARHFAKLAAEAGVPVISGGALGCDSAAHEGAMDAGGTTVVFFGGGCDWIYPLKNKALFQRVVDSGGLVVSEQPWDCHPRPFQFRNRNRLIAGLSLATLIVEAGLPSGTFSTADDALALGREVWAVPGAITSPTSAGSNRLIAQGAMPIVDDDGFLDALFCVFGAMRAPDRRSGVLDVPVGEGRPIIEAVMAQACTLEELMVVGRQVFGTEDARAKVMEVVSEAEAMGLIAKGKDGKFSPVFRQ